MARELVEKYVDGTEYKIEQFPATKSLRILTTLTKILGEPLSMAFALAKNEGMNDEKEAEILGKAVGTLCAKLDEDQVIHLVKELVASCLKGEGAKIQFETEFQGKIGHLFKLLKAILEVQYGDFLGELSSLTGGSEMTARQGTKVTSTGVSGV